MCLAGSERQVAGVQRGWAEAVMGGGVYANTAKRQSQAFWARCPVFYPAGR